MLGKIANVIGTRIPPAPPHVQTLPVCHAPILVPSRPVVNIQQPTIPWNPSSAPLYASNLTPLPAPSATPQAALSQNCKVVNLGGEDFAFDKTQVPDPPSIHFSDDIPRLFREWHSSTVLRIPINTGCSIPIKYWDLFYKKKSSVPGKEKAWGRVRMKWGNWKFIVEERDELGSDDAFWDVYSNENGERLRYQQILDKLKARRADRSACNAAAARSYFDGNLERADANGAF
ncbi:hypothetical protein SCP_0705730 [Sparassis crispa]|uniref:Uncharacterized protein n=1 Tax=Sparassis crispa TaxID=139825 RepID=A0A401GT14_9APHY|nr:hypothetical protein SCP_0705650 [Sparassis crispa]XP_027616299.1 hypothetical protein SCP_0705730 [Sparassis crispa]GBE85378.1 hypothetical protein SCP_0705650 [Sparassis crispa]GBE85386.1 hypothetical protein SCP_0705730 [Sparassis crispa]